MNKSRAHYGQSFILAINTKPEYISDTALVEIHSIVIHSFRLIPYSSSQIRHVPDVQLVLAVSQSTMRTWNAINNIAVTMHTIKQLPAHQKALVTLVFLFVIVHSS